MQESDSFKFSNFVAAFIDLLGQQDDLDGCGLLPVFTSEKDREAFLSVARESIGAIQSLHNNFNTFYESFYDTQREYEVPPKLENDFKSVQKTEVKFQRFSDGLVAYISLSEDSQSLPVNGLYSLIITCGSLCFVGLTTKKPLRAGIDLAWGIELNENELYGCVVSKAYRLESQVAQYPRVVVGNEVVQYLTYLANENEDDLHTKYNRVMANVCLKMLGTDSDGQYIVNYLGDYYRENIANSIDKDAFDDAYSYIEDQEKLYNKQDNAKLLSRYRHLKSYYDFYKTKWKSNV